MFSKFNVKIKMENYLLKTNIAKNLNQYLKNKTKQYKQHRKLKKNKKYVQKFILSYFIRLYRKGKLLFRIIIQTEVQLSNMYA